MTYMMKKERAFWASVCLLLSVTPELLNALPEKADEQSETTDSALPPMKPKQTFCAMKVDDGPCKAMIRSYFFNILTQQCEEFIYGGCRGNENRFETLEECKKTCIPGYKKTPVKTTSTAVNELPMGNYVPEQNIVNNTLIPQTTEASIRWEYHGPSWCLSPADSGLCQSSEKRFYYNPVIGKCRQFKYTGCGGNNNNFTTKKDCVKACKKGFIKRISKEGKVKTPRRKEPSVKIVYAAID